MRATELVVIASGLAWTMSNFACAPTFGAENGSTAITIYSSAVPGAISPDLYRPVPGAGNPDGVAVPGYAVVRQDRTLHIEAGRSTVRFTDVAALIEPTTVNFTSLTDTGTRVLEQNFQFDLVSTQKLLLKFIDRNVTVERAVGDKTMTTSGTLLAASDGLVLRGTDGSIQSLRTYDAVRFPDLPGGLDTRPTLIWDIQSPRTGDQRTRVTYQTGGVTWWADYNAVISDGKDSGSAQLDLSAWVSIVNQSGASYPDARLKLVAGDVNRIQEPAADLANEIAVTAIRKAAPAGFGEKPLLEFHLYTLGRETTLPNNSTKQIELFEQAHHVPAVRHLVYNGSGYAGGFYSSPMTDRNFALGGDTKVDATLEFRNDKASSLGIPLPAGRIRVSKLDPADQSLEFVGEDQIAHTARDEPVRVRLGSAFDVVGERHQVDFTVDTRARAMEEEFEITVRNHKDEPVAVEIREPLLRAATWNVLTSSQAYRKDDAHRISFDTKIPGGGAAKVRYRVRYTW